MVEEGIETQELKEKLEEAQEHAHASHPRAPWIMWLSLSTAILAVLAALAALASGSHANDAIVEKDDAILHQSKADDAWAFYQAKGVEAVVYATQAQSTPKPELAAKWQEESERMKHERTDIRREAEEEQKRVLESNEKSEHSLHVHHQFAKSVTLFQIAIALSAIAALTRKKPMWWVSLASGLVGVAFFAMGIASP